MKNSAGDKNIELNGEPPILVAHRGYSGRYPENTLLAYDAAYEQGARYMELDLQMTSDIQPVLHHDVSLRRMSDIDLDVRETPVDKFKALKANYAKRFSQEFYANSFTTFAEFCEWLQARPDVIIFVEMKQESIEHFGLEVFMQKVYQCIADNKVESQCVIISFNYKVIEYSRELSSIPIGWVLPKWSETNRQIAKQMQPEFLFADKNILPNEDSDIWQGNWHWAVYNLDDVSSAIRMANRGIPFLETNQIGDLISDQRLNK